MVNIEIELSEWVGKYGKFEVYHFRFRTPVIGYEITEPTLAGVARTILGSMVCDDVEKPRYVIDLVQGDRPRWAYRLGMYPFSASLTQQPANWKALELSNLLMNPQLFFSRETAERLKAKVVVHPTPFVVYAGGKS